MRPFHHALLAMFGATLLVGLSGCGADSGSGDGETYDESADALKGITTEPPADAPPARCYLDDNLYGPPDHIVEMRLRVTAEKVVGYIVRYRIRDGASDAYSYGTNNNEVLESSYGAKFSSVDWGEPGIWINRDKAMPDISRDQAWITIKAIGDHRGAPDRFCVVKFTDRGRVWKDIDNGDKSGAP